MKRRLIVFNNSQRKLSEILSSILWKINIYLVKMKIVKKIKIGKLEKREIAEKIFEINDVVKSFFSKLNRIYFIDVFFSFSEDYKHLKYKLYLTTSVKYLSDNIDKISKFFEDERIRQLFPSKLYIQDFVIFDLRKNKIEFYLDKNEKIEEIVKNLNCKYEIKLD